METRRFKLSQSTRRSTSHTPQQIAAAKKAAIDSIRTKLSTHNVKVETILERCIDLDVNDDLLIHADDLIDIISDLLPLNTISRREYHYLIAELSFESSQKVAYNRLEEVLKGVRQSQEEQWFDDYRDSDDSDLHGPFGSIGDFLRRQACPAERDNYLSFISLLEKYERESGMKVNANEDGFEVSFGPDLRANIAFFVKR